MKINQHSAKRTTRGFTLIEVMVVVTILGILAAITYFSVNAMRERARLARAMSDINNIVAAAELYKLDHGGRYPCNAARGQMPPVSGECGGVEGSGDPGIGAYLPGGVWPTGPWEGSLYDWDNVDDPDKTGKDSNGNPVDNDINADNIIQLSLRFCPSGTPVENCNFPQQPWAEDFTVNSSMYRCLRGECRSHTSFLTTQPPPPGYCLNVFAASRYCDGQPH
jgi:prepilin-type N-terminal cleavage/methylation domain-containing protein